MKRYGLLVLVILVLGGGLLFWKGTMQSPVTNKNPQTKQIPLPKEVVIALDKNGFSPKDVTIKAGTAVRWKNVSGDKQTVNSADHPTHQKHRELNFGLFNNGSTVAFVFKKPGTYGYHNHLKPEQTGTITVEAVN